MRRRIGSDQTLRDVVPGGNEGGYSRRDVLRIGAAMGAAGLLGASVLKEALRQGRIQRVTTTRVGLGTLITFTVLDDDRARADATIDGAFTEIERLESILSRHRPDTPVARLNREGHLDAPPADLVAVLREADRLAQRTRGAFDVTVAPLLRLYEESYRAGGPPVASDVERARERVGYEALRIEQGRVSFDRPGMEITLDGIAKGYVVDAMVDTLVGAGSGRVLVDAGGDIGSAGKTLNGGWRVGIQHPRRSRGSLGVVALKEGACMATSGDYMQAFEHDFRVHPIIDPRTGTSAALASSATVVARSALRADALSTAALVLGPEEGVQLIEQVQGAQALMVGKDGGLHATEGWRGERA